MMERLRAVQGILFALFCALCAELFFFNFTVSSDYWSGAGRVAIIFLSLFILHRFALAAFSSYRPEPKDVFCLTLIIFGGIFTAWAGRIVALSLADYAMKIPYLRGLSAGSFYFAIPFAAGGLMLQAVLGLQHGLLYALASTIIVVVYFPSEPLLALYVLATSLMACLSLSRFRSRSAYIKAGLNVSFIAFAFALASVVIDGNPYVADIALRLVGAVVSGVLCTFAAAGVTPILEYLGGYVTDMRLLEMATLDHPLLKELSIRAPGTWNHSMVMGMMGESASEAIGANPISTRVGAYFHDIGKMTKPLYFVENQAGEDNRHDKLSPSMSALIIRSHVKEGIELAREHKLPRVIEDMIPQHHGLSRIEYFYEKARREAEEAGEDPDSVDPNLYSYPGPKPQTKEAGILMLADGIEASCRTLSEPTLDRIQGLVQKMINKVFASGELDECDLTLKDLHQIAKCFTRTLAGIYHQRIAYAEPAEKISEKEEEVVAEAALEDGAAETVAAGGAAKKPKVEGEERPAKEPRKEDLKRLGM